MYKVEPTEHALILNSAFQKVGIETELEHFDGHKHIDIYIPKGKIYIEVDGPNHYTNHLQMIDDFKRDKYSTEDGFHTVHIPNAVVEKDSIKIARAFKKMLNY